MISLINAVYKRGDVCISTELDFNGRILTLRLVGTSEAEFSLSGIFATAANGIAQMDVSSLPDGEHTLFLHYEKESVVIAKLEKIGKSIRRIITESDYMKLEYDYATLCRNLDSLEKRVTTLEKEAFESVLF